MIIPRKYGKQTKEHIQYFTIGSFIMFGFLVWGFISKIDGAIGIGVIGIVICSIGIIRAIYNEKNGKGNSDIEVC